MKTGKLIALLTALMFNTVMGGFLATLVGAPIGVGILGMNGIGFLMGFLPIPGLRAGIYKEVWERKVLEMLSTSEIASFLDGIDDKSDKVTGTEEAQTINMIDFGVEPDVLIDNMDYPIPEQELNASNIPISLNKYQTKVTPITDDELQGLAFDKIERVTKSHVNSIEKNKFKKSIHNLAPVKNTAQTPVLFSTGADDGTGRKRLVFADIVSLKSEFDKLEIPEQGRRLVLSTDHANDVLLFDNVFKERYSNEQTGKIMNLAGFDVYSYVANPYFNSTTKEKKSFGAVPSEGDYRASVAFYVPRMVKAKGRLKMYQAKAENDPYHQKTAISFRHFFIVMPTKQEAIGAIASAKV